MAKRKRTNNNLQNTTQKTKDRKTQTPLKTINWCSDVWQFDLQLQISVNHYYMTIMLVSVIPSHDEVICGSSVVFVALTQIFCTKTTLIFNIVERSIRQIQSILYIKITQRNPNMCPLYTGLNYMCYYFMEKIRLSF